MKAEAPEHLKPKSQYADEAVQLAIAGNWEEAVELNQFIIEHFSPDEEAQNRLGKALTELGRLDDAKVAYETSLGINPRNSIARRNASKLDTLLHAKLGTHSGSARVDLNLFVEEMGRTVTTILDNVDDKDVCSMTAPGDLAELRIEGSAIISETVRGVRLGQIESKLARKLIKFIKDGNRYQAGVTACDGVTVKLIIRETYQDPKFAGKPSFPTRRPRSAASESRYYAKTAVPVRETSFDEADEDEDRVRVIDLEGMSVVEAEDDLEEPEEEIEIDETMDLDDTEQKEEEESAAPKRGRR